MGAAMLTRFRPGLPCLLVVTGFMMIGHPVAAQESAPLPAEATAAEVAVVPAPTVSELRTIIREDADEAQRQEAFELLTAMASDGDGSAAFSLGEMYRTG